MVIGELTGRAALKHFFLNTRLGAAITLVVSMYLFLKAAELGARLGLVTHCNPSWGKLDPSCYVEYDEDGPTELDRY
jgi:hypothetical protein